MSSASIRKRVTSKGEPRWLVYYRVAGRESKTIYGGSFKTKREAQQRRDLIAGALAVGRNPKDVLRTPQIAPGLAAVWDDWAASRTDVQAKAHALYKNARAWWLRILGDDRDPHTITPADVIAGIKLMRETLAASSIRQYVSHLRMVLDHADVIPNPVRSPKVKLPPMRRTEIHIPATAAWHAIRSASRRRSRLTLELMECEGLRVSEACNLTWADIDFHQRQLRIAHTKTDAGRRLLPVPDELLDRIDSLQGVEDRSPAARVFGLDHTQVRYDVAQACVTAGVPGHSPHDLRHRRISLWVRHGIDPVQVATWAGHARSSMSLDVYGHVMVDAEDDEWREFWLDVYRPARSLA